MANVNLFCNTCKYIGSPKGIGLQCPKCNSKDIEIEVDNNDGGYDEIVAFDNSNSGEEHQDID